MILTIPKSLVKIRAKYARALEVLMEKTFNEL